MGCFVAAGIMGLIALILVISASIVSGSEKNFVKNKRQGKAQVIGYEQDEGSASSNLSVRLLDINDQKAYYCSSNTWNTSAKYPVGAIIDVEYAPSGFGYEVHLLEQHWGENSRSAKVFLIVAGFFFVIAMVLLMVGLLNLK